MAAQVAEAAKELAAKVASPADDQLMKDEKANLETGLDQLQAEVESLIESSRRERDDRLIETEKRQLDLDKIKVEVASLSESLSRDRDLHSFRKIVLVALFILVVGWLVSVICAVWLSARYGSELYVAAKPGFIFKLSDPVLIAFISSTTVSVIGIFVIAAKWLFPSTASNGAAKKNG